MIVSERNTVDGLRRHLEVANRALVSGGSEETTVKAIEDLVKRITHYERAIKRL